MPRLIRAYLLSTAGVILGAIPMGILSARGLVENNVIVLVGISYCMGFSTFHLMGMLRWRPSMRWLNFVLVSCIALAPQFLVVGALSLLSIILVDPSVEYRGTTAHPPSYQLVTLIIAGIVAYHAHIVFHKWEQRLYTSPE